LVAGLVACGGGSNAPAPTLADTPAVSISPANLVGAKATVGALIGTPAVTLPALTSKEGVAIAAGTTLKLDPVPAGASAGALAGFTLTTGNLTSTGVLEAGSCKFKVTGGNNLPYIGTVFTFDPCSIDFNTAGVPADGTTQTVAVKYSLGGVDVNFSYSVVVTVVNGVPSIAFAGGAVYTGTLASGSGS
jgi:hypothetical protein